MAKPKMTFQVKPAKGLIRAYMRLCGFDGWASAWGVAYIMPDKMHDKPLIAHEICHLCQMQKEGVFRFLVRYSWYLVRYGYRKNPYEVECRKVQSQTQP